MAPQTMKRYILAHRNGIDGLNLETDAPVPELRSSTDASRPLRSFQTTPGLWKLFMG